MEGSAVTCLSGGCRPGTDEPDTQAKRVGMMSKSKAVRQVGQVEQVGQVAAVAPYVPDTSGGLGPRVIGRYRVPGGTGGAGTVRVVYDRYMVTARAVGIGTVYLCPSGSWGLGKGRGIWTGQEAREQVAQVRAELAAAIDKALAAGDSDRAGTLRAMFGSVAAVAEGVES